MPALRRTIVPYVAAGAQGAVSVDPVTGILTGSNRTIMVGPGQQHADLQTVLMDTLGPGDAVNVLYRPEPYKDKFALVGQGLPNAWIEINGVTDSQGRRPVFDFNGARTVPTAQQVYDPVLQHGESLGGILFTKRRTDPYRGYKPQYIRLRNLALRGAAKGNSYITRAGGTATYDVAANIFGLLAADVDLINCVSTDGSFGLFTQAKDGELAFACERWTLRNSRFFNNGVVGSYYEHNVYLQCTNPLTEGNYFGKVRPGSLGGSYKTRCSGEVFRRNSVVASARALDFVQSEHQDIDGIVRQSDYGYDYVYANKIVSDGPECIHYGGDNDGEQNQTGPIFAAPASYRRNLRFWGNDFTLTASTWRAVVFMLSAREIKADAWDNTIRINGVTMPAWMWFAGQLRLGQNNVASSNPMTDARDAAIDDGRYRVERGVAVPNDPNIALVAA